MPKLTLDMHTFKALASDTRLDILKALDGKRMSLKDLGRITKLNKATLHEHLAKLNEAGLIKKKEREGHKWVYYKLTWKGEGLLHPENTRIVVMFSATFVSLLLAFILIVNFLQPMAVGFAETVDDTTYLYEIKDEGTPLMARSYSYNYLGEIDAKEKTVGNITTELQKIASPRNSIGANYADEEIVWRAAGDVVSYAVESNGAAEPCVTDEIHFGFYDYIEPSQIIVYSWNYTNQSFNDTKVSNETDDNETNESLTPGFEGDEGSLVGYSPVVPEMIATVQDTTLLYFAIVCLAFFGALFTLSTWRLWVNKKPKL
jgi:DNA-binding transcriptional ArsR family regulator